VGQRGPVSNAPEIARLRGTFRPHRHNARATPLQALGELGPPSARLDIAGKRLWRETAEGAPWLRAVDRPLLDIFCESVLRWRAALTTLRNAEASSVDMVSEDVDALRERLRAAARDTRENARLLALPPAARARLTSEPPNEEQRFGFVLIKGGRSA
jgi:phage terminase small subunit